MAHDECDLHRNYVFGDRKSIELLNAFRSDLQGRGITLNDMNEQCDEFEKALDTLMSLPGDWHMGFKYGRFNLQDILQTPSSTGPGPSTMETNQL